MQPEYVTEDLLDAAIDQVKKKKDLASISAIRFESYHEGEAVQIMHIGPFSEEGPTIERVHDFIHESGYKRFGKHHEIYLSDIRKAAPEKWKTIIRQPMRQD